MNSTKPREAIRPSHPSWRPSVATVVGSNLRVHGDYVVQITGLHAVSPEVRNTIVFGRTLVLRRSNALIMFAGVAFSTRSTAKLSLRRPWAKASASVCT